MTPPTIEPPPASQEAIGTKGGRRKKRPPPTSPPLVVGAAEAARLLGISPRTLWTLTAEGHIPAFWIGGQKRYRLDDLNAFIEANPVGARRRRRKGAGR